MAKPLGLIRHPTDGYVHWSELREMRRSPAHYRYACQTAREISRAMRVGFITDRVVFAGSHAMCSNPPEPGIYQRAMANIAGDPLTGRLLGPAMGFRVYPGSRQGNAWLAFEEAAHLAREMPVTQSEYEDAIGAARAVLANPVAAPILARCEHQRVLQWNADGLEFATGIHGERGGLDAYDPTTWTIYDLKTTASADPTELSRHVIRQLWHAQMALYSDGATASGLRVTGAAIIAVESSPPHPVSVVRLPAALLDMGRRAIRLWIERLKACDASGEWPGYVQSEVELQVPEWLEAMAEMEVGA